MPTRHYERFETALRDRGLDARTVEIMFDRPRTARTVGYHELIEGPVHDAVEAARADAGGGAVALIGHSIGGQLAVLYAAVHPAAVSAVALPAAGTVHWRAFPRRRGLGFLAFTQAAGATARVTGAWPGHRLGFGGHQPTRLMRDWARIARTGRFRPTGAPTRYERALRDLDLPVLALTMPGDELAPRSAADALIAATGATEVTRRHLEADDFARTPGHAGWLREPASVAAAISTWIAEGSTGSTGAAG